MTQRHDHIAQAVMVVDGCDSLRNVAIQKTDPFMYKRASLVNYDIHVCDSGRRSDAFSLAGSDTPKLFFPFDVVIGLGFSLL